MGWNLEFDVDALKDLKKLDKTVRNRIIKYLKTRIKARYRSLGIESAWFTLIKKITPKPYLKVSKTDVWITA
ncbi:type II toxin-antitoxin system RelE family toxin [Magnetococcales bacterium HHB-1]